MVNAKHMPDCDVTGNETNKYTQKAQQSVYLFYCIFCDLQPVTCDLQPVICDLQPVTCDLQPVTCDLQPVTCDL